MSERAQRWGTIETPFSTFACWVDERGRVTRLRLRADDAASIDAAAIHDEREIEHVRRQVLEYCAGQRTAFELELAAEGSAFQHAVWEALLQIRFGETTSYGALAARVGRPRAARAVGLANASNPIALIVPCHRVIGADGRLTGYAGGLPLKRALLEHEAALAPAGLPA